MVMNCKKQKCARLGLCLSIFFLMILLCPKELFAADAYVVDDANLLTEQEEADLFEQTQEMVEQTGWEIFLVTTADAEGKSSMAYADDYYDAIVDDADGFLFLIDMDNREIYMSTCGNAIRYYTDSRIDVIVSEGAEYAGDANYASCLSVMLEEAMGYYEMGIPSNQANYDTETGKLSKYHSLTVCDIVIALVVGVIAGGIVFFCIKVNYQFKSSTYHYSPERDGRIDCDVKRDQLVNSFVHHHHIQKDNNGGGGGNISRTHTSSGGNRHGGGGHGF